jgi:hypothetical protein
MLQRQQLACSGCGAPVTTAVAAVPSLLDGGRSWQLRACRPAAAALGCAAVSRRCTVPARLLLADAAASCLMLLPHSLPLLLLPMLLPMLLTSLRAQASPSAAA